jgi:archaeoflavoprotein AfpA
MTTEAEIVSKKEEKNKKRVAWGITGSGDKLVETVDSMKQLKKLYYNDVSISVYLSKAGDQVAKYYSVANDLKDNFQKVWIEINSNSPFLAGELELGKFEFLLIAPATSNTVAKISLGIADSLLSNAAIMAFKGFVPVYVMPSDYQEGVTTTELPDGQTIKLRIRREDAANVKKLAAMQDVFILEKPADINHVFRKHFGLEA